MITQQDIDKSMSFEQLYQLTETLVKDGDTTGSDKSSAMVNYTKLNFSRMKRILKTTPISDDVLNTVECLSDKLTWLVLVPNSFKF